MTTSNTVAKNKIRAVLIDLSGTLHIGDQAIPGAREALEKLRQSGRRVKFLTNTSNKSTAQLLQQLNQGLDFNIAREELVTSVLATAAYIKKHKLKPLCLMEDTSDLSFSTSEATQQQQQEPEQHQQDGTEATVSCSYDSVVVGLAPSQFHYQQLNKAFRILLDYPNNLIAIHRGNYIRDPVDKELSLGPGAFVTALEAASHCSAAKVMGKPSRTFFESAIWNDIPVAETCMIGDDVLGDIQGAQQAGIGTTILVQTGKFRTGDEEKMGRRTSMNEGKPSLETQQQQQLNTFFCPSFVEAVEFILSTPQA